MGALDGRVAIITGAGRGIGREHALLFASEGAKVVINDLGGAPDGSGSDKGAAEQVADEIKGMGGEAVANADDVADWDGGRQLVEAAVEAFGRLDVLVNNAGIFPYGPFEQMGLDELDRTLAVHVRAPFVAAQAASPHLPRGGRIISIGSNLAERVADPGVTAYAMSKAALTGFSRALARELGPRGITVNCVAPGPIDTDIMGGTLTDERKAAMAADGVLPRIGTPRDVAAAIAYLICEDAGFVTGQTLNVDGGLYMH